jgi:diaminohydroxyphosphoribosylaminopyrimidine deaminase/5-amino-6-(5-phosphoribosylamino)uracil reductase
LRSYGANGYLGESIAMARSRDAIEASWHSMVSGTGTGTCTGGNEYVSAIRSLSDEAHMRLALRLARRGIEAVSPNPMVGAVLARGDRVIGSGWHRRFGGAHAEIEALRSARSPRGADLYVTLEPCAHHGKTPPCAEAIAAAGVRRVVFGARDPNPATSGKGPRFLRSRGIPVEHGVLRAECERLNAPFFHWIATGHPWVILKWGMTIDGKTATAGGESKWITGDAARARAHALRRRVDGILVGTETALRDDPVLTPRPARGRRPWRIVLDRTGRLPLGLGILAENGARESGGPRLYIAGPRVAPRRLRLLESRGVRVLIVREKAGGLDLESLLRELGALGISQLLVEGGATLAGGFLDRGLADEVAAYIAPRIAGGRDATPALAGKGLALLAETPWIESPSIRRIGRDIAIEGRLVRPPRRRRS